MAEVVTILLILNVHGDSAALKILTLFEKLLFEKLPGVGSLVLTAVDSNTLPERQPRQANAIRKNCRVVSGFVCANRSVV